MEGSRHRPLCLGLWVVLLSLTAATHAQDGQTPTAAHEEFLRHANVVAERRTPGHPYGWRVTLDDGRRRHEAVVETEDGTTASHRNYRGNVAAYELDKLLDLRMVAPSVIRAVDGRQAAVTWWVDDVAMMESDRRAKKIDPPNAYAWNNEMAVVRVFDELISNAYRNIDSDRDVPAADDGPPPSDKWTELLITRDWRVWLIDHTGSFRNRRQLQHPESLTRCDRALLAKLRALNRNVFEARLTPHLAPAQLDTLETRRGLLVKHFDDEIARRGEPSVLYDRR